ncbi:hypothetical protein CDAR_474511 [Caerostris darwini]|uniref:Secreted protein n=1 Tax=Caerostris darwini TaxID=1538125 RepID=A0AAV4PJR7_9ARAC|nr:hypothetical protein CDAR_474511 [Caerostris darwini]
MLQLNFSFFFICFESICIHVKEKTTSQNFPEEIARVITHANPVPGDVLLGLFSIFEIHSMGISASFEVILASPESKSRHCTIGRRNEIVVFLSFEKRRVAIWNE